MNLRDLSWTNIKEWVSKTISFIKEYRLAEYTIAILAFLYIVIGYGSKLMESYENHVIKPYGSQFESNIWLLLLLVAFLLIISYKIYINYKNRCQCNPILSIILSYIGIILLICRLSGKYDYAKLIGCLSYCDVLILICFAYPIFAATNYIRFIKALKLKSQSRLLDDRPIDDVKKDELKYRDEARKIAEDFDIRLEDYIKVESLD